MIRNNDNRRPSTALRAISWSLESLGLLITATAAVIVFFAIPYDLLERWRLLPHWDIFWLFFIFVPFIAAWDRAGPFLLLTVMSCEIALTLLKPGVKKVKIAAVVSIMVCIAAYVWIFIARRSNVH